MLAKQNGFIQWMKGLTKEEQEECIAVARRRAKHIFGIVKDDQEVEKEIMIQEAQSVRELNLERERVNKQKLDTLSANIFHCIPSNMDRYNQCFKECRRKTNENMTEKKFLQTLLKILKITLKSKKLPPTKFTISANGKQLTLPQLKVKLRELL